MSSAIRQVGILGNYVPRRCGIATFTSDLAEGLAAARSDVNVTALAMNDTPEGYDYPERVEYALPQEDPGAYQRAAEFLNIQGIDALSVQHEFGIYGGEDGRLLIDLIKEVEAPVITTLHTVLKEPTPGQRNVMEALARYSSRLVVMSERGREFLRTIYGVPADRIDVIHHGIPDVPFIDPNYYKPHFNVEGKTVLLTFGLLAPSKGIEHVIQALPRIRERFPDVVYLVLGATHPHLIRHEGEAYRERLHRMAEELGVSGHVHFHNRFVALDELVSYIGAADVYITPYLNECQITSGTLAYASGAGKAVISTPYWHATELLAGGRGVIVPFRDPGAIAERTIELLENDAERHAMRIRAYAAGREMVWPLVAEDHFASMERALESRQTRPVPRPLPQKTMTYSERSPILKFDHLMRLTDDTGVLQHAKYVLPNYWEGYTTDDNARALVLTSLLSDPDDTSASQLRRIESRYLAFLQYAFNHDSGRFRNFMAYERSWLEAVGSEDSHGRAVWALGIASSRLRERGKRHLASRMFGQALSAVWSFSSPRAWAFALAGIDSYLARHPGHRPAQRLGRELAGRLYGLYTATAAQDWRWFEDSLCYANAKLPHALLLAGARFQNDAYTDAGYDALRWLCRIQRPDGHFAPIGCNGFYVQSGPRARFDQQPIDAHATVSACLAAHRISNDAEWLDEAQTAFDWFLGRNDLRTALYDPWTGGCYDGLTPNGVNQNQGAESTLSFLLALVELRTHAEQFKAPVQPRVTEPQEHRVAAKQPEIEGGRSSARWMTSR